jgi:iron complex transport system permease protein
MAALVGGGLALSGAVMQGIFQNPMADPGLLGVSSGAALGAVLALHLGVAVQHYLMLPGFAFLGGLAAASIVYGLATSGGKTPVATLLLSGVALSSLSAALTSFILTRSRDSMIREILFWLMGGLEASSWDHVRLTTPVVLFGVAIILLFTRDLDILLCGDQRALTLGVDAQWCRLLLLTLATAVTAVVVSLSGTVGFVGLIVPHMLRLLVGPQHHRLLPMSFLGGALFLILADLVARILVRPQEVRLGIITAFVGVPFFLYLLRTNRRGLEPL